MIRWRDTHGARRLISTAVKLELAQRAARERENSAPVQYALAAASFHVEDYDSGIAAFECGMRLDPPEPDSVAGYVKALLAKDRALEALDVLDKYADAEASSVKLLVQRGIALRRIGRLDAATEALRKALARCPTDVEAGMAMQSLLASRKDWAGLLEFVENQAQRDAITMPVMLAWVAGLVGLGRNAEAAQLLDFDALVLVRTVDPPDGFPSLSAFNAALARDVMSTRKIRLSNVPRLKMTGGVQVEDLETDSSPAMSALFALLERAVEDYAAKRAGARSDVVRAIIPETARLEAWALVLGPGDTQDRHFHLRSSVAGVYYVSAPDDLLAAGSVDGCLEIPCAPSNGAEPLVQPRLVQPLPGRLVLFPGYIPHRTTRMRCVGERISIAFDVAPE